MSMTEVINVVILTLSSASLALALHSCVMAWPRASRRSQRVGTLRTHLLNPPAAADYQVPVNRRTHGPIKLEKRVLRSYAPLNKDCVKADYGALTDTFVLLLTCTTAWRLEIRHFLQPFAAPAPTHHAG
jgi:hypothetical protein